MGSSKNFLWAASVMAALLLSCLSHGYTDEQDVYAINSLYASLGLPPLPGWIPEGGDPCQEGWQGVQCVGPNITAIVISAANLGGLLGDHLENFTSIITLDLSNNNIGGRIPDNLPITMRRFFISNNQLTGSIPSSLAGLTLLSDMSLSKNHLTGELPDAFQFLTGLINLDLSSNNLSGQLPPSLGNLSTLTSLHLQDNKLSGILNVLQDLPLKDLNIGNNLFSGPVPEKLFDIPNFIRNWNPFNTSIAPAPSPVSQLPSPTPLSGAPVPQAVPTNFSDGPASHISGPSEMQSSSSTIKFIVYALLAVVLVIAAVLLVIFCISKCQERKSKHHNLSKREEVGVHGSPGRNEHFIVSKDKANGIAAPKEAAKEQQKEPSFYTTRKVQRENFGGKELVVHKGGSDVLVMPPPVERVVIKPIPSHGKINRNGLCENVNALNSAVSFSIAFLKQYTNSFRDENMIRDGRFGKVYMAKLPDGKLLAVMNLHNMNSKLPEYGFLELVWRISDLKHLNVLKLVGYCVEFGQRLLVYDYFSKLSLLDVLHFGDALKRKLSWNARLHIALEAAKALEYLHEGCQPPVVHRTFELDNILLDDELSVCVSECGLASLMSSNSVTQLPGHLHSVLGYEAPEVDESRTYTDRSDVYSFGVVLLELLTGRKPYDSSRPRAEQHLVRWFSSQLHDISALSRMADPSIGSMYSKKSLSRLTDIISRCIQRGPEFRPSMSEVVQDLTQTIEDSRARANGGPSQL